MADHPVQLEDIVPKEPSGVVHVSKRESIDFKSTEAHLSLVHTSTNDLHSPTAQQKKRARIQLLSLGWTLFMVGWNDGSTGPLLPRIQEVYHVGFALVSLIFVFACVGFIGGAILSMYITDKFGFGKIILLGASLQVIAYAIQVAAPPFPAFILVYVINGVGLALQDALASGFVGAMHSSPETKMGMIQAAYGLGAFCAPFSATQFAQLDRWSFHFMISLGIALSNVAFLATVFGFKSQDECHAEGGEVIPERNPASERGKIRQIMSTPAVHYLAFYLMVFVGVEVTIGGWIVTFIIQERRGGPSSGYISSGFFGGLTLGRILLLWVNKKVGEWRVVFIYSAIAISLQFTVWFVPNLIQNAVAVSIVGILLGPMYPITINQAARILPRWILTGSIGWIAGFGQAGSAIIPFMTGAIAASRGISSLQPLLIAMMVLMSILWAFVPRAPHRTD